MPEIHNIEQRSDAWRKIRCGLPTGSEFSKLITSEGEISKSLSGYAMTLAAELFAGGPIDDSWAGNAWTERGKEMEAEAIRLYEFATDQTVTPVGFVTDDAKTMGCSPDGLVGDDGMVEVKCLKTENHVKAILYFQKNGRCQTDYVQQTQGELMICERQWNDLILFHPQLPVLTIRQLPNPKLHGALKTAIVSVRAERNIILRAIQAQNGPVSIEVGK